MKHRFNKIRFNKTVLNKAVNLASISALALASITSPLFSQPNPKPKPNNKEIIDEFSRYKYEITAPDDNIRFDLLQVSKRAVETDMVRVYYENNNGLPELVIDFGMHIDDNNHLVRNDIEFPLLMKIPSIYADDLSNVKVILSIKDKDDREIFRQTQQYSDSTRDILINAAELSNGQYRIYDIIEIHGNYSLLFPASVLHEWDIIDEDSENDSITIKRLIGYITIGEFNKVSDICPADVLSTVQREDVNYISVRGYIGTLFLGVWTGDWNPEHPTAPDYVSMDEFKEAISNMAQSAVLGNVPDFSDDARDYFINYAQIVRRVLARYSGSEHQDWVDEFDDVIDQVRNGTLSLFDAYERIFNIDPSTGYSANLPRGIDTLDAAVGILTKGESLFSFIPGMGYSAKFTYNSIKALYSDKPISLYEASISIGEQQYVPIVITGEDYAQFSVWCKSVGAEVHFKALPLSAIIGLRARIKEVLPKVSFYDLVNKGLEGAFKDEDVQSDVNIIYRPMRWRLHKSMFHAGIAGLYAGERRIIRKDDEWRLIGQEIGDDKYYYCGLSLFIKSKGIRVIVTGETSITDTSSFYKPVIMGDVSLNMGKGWNITLKSSDYSQLKLVYADFEIGKDKIYGVNTKLSVGAYYDLEYKQIRGPNVKLEIEF